MPARYSRYIDESWEGKPAGQHGMQPRMRHMFTSKGIDLRGVPAANLVFVRSTSEAELASKQDDLLRHCWPVHEAVIENLRISTILCLGGTAGSWVRTAIGADQLIATYHETNARGWKSEAHIASDGRAMVTVSHPARADWRNPEADPTPLVKAVLNR